MLYYLSAEIRFKLMHATLENIMELSYFHNLRETNFKMDARIEKESVLHANT